MIGNWGDLLWRMEPASVAHLGRVRELRPGVRQVRGWRADQVDQCLDEVVRRGVVEAFDGRAGIASRSLSIETRRQLSQARRRRDYLSRRDDQLAAKASQYERCRRDYEVACRLWETWKPGVPFLPIRDFKRMYWAAFQVDPAEMISSLLDAPVKRRFSFAHTENSFSPPPGAFA